VPATARWWAGETASDGWWAVDQRHGVAYEIPVETGIALWRYGNGAASLDDELSRIRTGGAADVGEHVFDLEFAGVRGRYHVEDREVGATLEGWFPACAPRLRATPDVHVRVGAHADYEKLHRAVKGERTDVHIRTAGEEAWRPAGADLPVLPAFQQTPLEYTHVGLHAALVLRGERALIVMGPQRSGKTTAALLAAELGATVATDELTLLTAGALVHGVPLPLRVRSADGRHVRPLDAFPTLRDQPVRATDVMLLDAAADPHQVERQSDGRASMAAISAHLRPLGQSVGRTARLAVEFLREVVVWRLAPRAWPDLEYDLRQALVTILDGAGGA
jgi:hypothetical protein